MVVRYQSRYIDRGLIDSDQVFSIDHSTGIERRCPLRNMAHIFNPKNTKSININDNHRLARVTFLSSLVEKSNAWRPSTAFRFTNKVAKTVSRDIKKVYHFLRLLSSYSSFPRVFLTSSRSKPIIRNPDVGFDRHSFDFAYHQSSWSTTTEGPSDINNVSIM